MRLYVCASCPLTYLVVGYYIHVNMYISSTHAAEQLLLPTIRKQTNNIEGKQPKSEKKARIVVVVTMFESTKNAFFKI